MNTQSDITYSTARLISVGGKNPEMSSVCPLLLTNVKFFRVSFAIAGLVDGSLKYFIPLNSSAMTGRTCVIYSCSALAPLK